MAKKFVRISALDGRIKQGKADPITSAEKRLVAELRMGYEQKYGPSRSAMTGRRSASAASGTSPKFSTEESASRVPK